MSLFSTFFGGFGGIIVEKIGYLNMFILAFSASIPAMVLMFWVPMHEKAPSEAPDIKA
jgi:heme O synthase-like polyprenyltransferase